MPLTAAMTAALAPLSVALHDPVCDDIDLEELLSEFAAATKRVVHSYLGMSLSITSAVGNFSLTAMDDPRHLTDIVASLHLPLKTTPGATTNSTVTFYAGKAGAFVDLAADIGWILRLTPELLILNGHLTIPDQDSNTGSGPISLANQAIGVLIERGHRPEDAASELHRLARRAGLSLVEFVAQLLLDVQRNAP